MDDSPATSKAEQVARHLLNTIIARQLKPGDTCGTEAELLERYNVSRPTLRESLRVLEAQGVLQLRPGPKGGILVAQPSTDILAHSLSVHLRLHDVPFVSVLKAREVIEPALAAEAAVNGTEEDFADLEASIERMKAVTDTQAFIEENRLFHSIVARASGSEVMEIFWQIISILAVGEHHGIPILADHYREVIEAHEAILDACRRRQPKEAAEKMEAHMSAFEAVVRKYYESQLESPTNVVPKRSRLRRSGRHSA